MATRRGRQQAYSAGNKTYGSGRSNPTMGPVDPTGYRERDAQRMAFTPSYTQSAIQRRLGNQQVSYRPPTTVPNRLPAPIADPVGNIKPTPVAQAEQQTQFGPGITVGPHTQPTPKVPKPNNVGELPYDPEYELEQRRLAQDQADYENQLAELETRQRGSIADQKRRLELERPEALKDVLENFAGRGMAYSGRYVTDRGRTEGRFAEALSGLDTDLMEFLQDMARGKADWTKNRTRRLEDIQLAAARRAAERAGELGYDDEEYDEGGDIPGVARTRPPRLAAPSTPFNTIPAAQRDQFADAIRRKLGANRRPVRRLV